MLITSMIHAVFSELCVYILPVHTVGYWGNSVFWKPGLVCTESLTRCGLAYDAAEFRLIKPNHAP